MDDTDTGGNDLQNFPVITAVTYVNPTKVNIQGTLHSQASTSFYLEMFGNDGCDPSGYGEGQVYLGSTTLLTNSSHNGSFSVVLTVPQPYLFITATATDPSGNTSEFSLCQAASSVYLPLVHK